MSTTQPLRRFTVDHAAAEVQRDPGARVLWPAVGVEEPVGAFLLSLSAAGRTVVHVEHGGALIRVVVERVEPCEDPNVLPGFAKVDDATEIQHTIACDNTDRELCDCADYPPEPSR